MIQYDNQFVIQCGRAWARAVPRSLVPRAKRRRAAVPWAEKCPTVTWEDCLSLCVVCHLQLPAVGRIILKRERSPGRHDAARIIRAHASWLAKSGYERPSQSTVNISSRKGVLTFAPSYHVSCTSTQALEHTVHRLGVFGMSNQNSLPSLEHNYGLLDA